MNTFRGMLTKLPLGVPHDDPVGLYIYAFSDFYAHLPRTVFQNSSYYSALIAILVSSYLGALLLKLMGLDSPRIKRIRRILAFVNIVIIGFGLRFFFAYHTTCNHDVARAYLSRDYFVEGKNIYMQTLAPYSPLWYSINYVVGLIARFFPQFAFMFILRAFLSLVDLVTLFFIVRIAKLIHFSPQKSAFLFFLSPVSIIISGYHGQIENLTILFLVAAIYLFLRFGERTKYIGWFLISIGVAIKHLIVNQVLIFLRHTERSWIKIFILFCLTGVFFASLFIPFWKEGKDGIIAGLQYSGMRPSYGFINFITNENAATVYKYVFLVMLFSWSIILKTKSIIRDCLLGFLFFLVFTFGISAQQFVIPIALGALIPSFGFYLYSLIASLFLFGDINELKITLFQPFNWNCVWIAAIVWFFIEAKRAFPQVAKNLNTAKF
jgi:hypothetical protein